MTTKGNVMSNALKNALRILASVLAIAVLAPAPSTLAQAPGAAPRPAGK